MMVPIKHRKCGGQTAWYLRDEGKEGDIFSVKEYMRMDGTQPKYGDVFREKCASCGEWIYGANALQRDFSDKRPNVEHNRRPQGVRVDGPVGPHTQED